MPVTVRLRKARYNTAPRALWRLPNTAQGAPQEERRMEKKAWAIAEQYLLGEVWYWDALPWLADQLDPHWERATDEVVQEAQDLLDESILKVWKKWRWEDVLSLTAEQLRTGELDEYGALQRIRRYLDPFGDKSSNEGECGTHRKAQELVKQLLQ